MNKSEKKSENEQKAERCHAATYGVVLKLNLGSQKRINKIRKADMMDMDEMGSARSAGSEAVDLQQELILEEYRIWKKNTSHLYDLCLAQSLEWPSLTVQWLPTHDVPQSSDFSIQKVLIGTHTIGNEQNQIKVARVRIPLADASLDGLQEKLNDDISKDIAAAPGSEVKQTIAIQTTIAHQGDVHRARVMPQKSHIFATLSETGDAFIWDYTKHPTRPKTQETHPQLRLVGHSKEGYGLDWNSHVEGRLLTAAFDGHLILWDVGAASALNQELAPLSDINSEQEDINDAKWHKFDLNLYAAAHDGGTLSFWDSRGKEAMNSFIAHNGDCIALDFNYHNSYLMASGASDKLVKVWDLRKPQTALMILAAHTFPIQSLTFSPFYEGVLASAGKDRRVIWWNLHDVINETNEFPITSTWKMTEGPGKTTPPGLIFMHSGHTAEVPDIAWNKNEPMVMASTGQDNQLQVFSWNAFKYAPASLKAD